jgi:hypothetical protein
LSYSRFSRFLRCPNLVSKHSLAGLEKELQLKHVLDAEFQRASDDVCLISPNIAVLEIAAINPPKRAIFRLFSTFDFAPFW